MNYAINEAPPSYAAAPPAPAPTPSNKLMERMEALEEFAKVMLQTYQITYPNNPAPYAYTGSPQGLLGSFVRD